MYDYDARQMESALGRFTTVDPLTEKYYNCSPYNYCANNPIKYIDPNGKDWYWIDNDDKNKRSLQYDPNVTEKSIPPEDVYNNLKPL